MERKKLSASSNIFIHRIFKGIADSSIKIFIPLLIYKSTQNLMLCFYYGVIEYFLTALFFYCFKKVVRKNPIIFIIIHIFPIIAIEFLLLMNLNYFNLAFIAFLSALASVFYYGSMNLLFGIMDKKTDTAKFETGQHLGKIIFTLLSAYILGNLNNSLIFVVIFSLLIYLISIIPICVNYKEIKQELKILPEQKFKEVIKDNKYCSFYHLFAGVFAVFSEVILPLYLYVLGLSFSVVGILVALQYLLSIFGNYFAQYMKNKGFSKIIIIICSFFIFISLISIVFIRDSLVIYIFTIINTVSFQMLNTICFSMFVKEQMQKGFYHESIFLRDIFLNSARLIICLSYFVIPYFSVMFVIGIGSSVGIGASSIKCLPKEIKSEN